MSTVNAFADVYRAIADEMCTRGPSASSSGHEAIAHNAAYYAVKTDMARSMKFLEAAGMDGYFRGIFKGTPHEAFLEEARLDMPVYVNKDEQAFQGRSRPKGVHDIREKMDTVTGIRRSLESFGLTKDVEALDRLMAGHCENVAESKHKSPQHYVGDMVLSGEDEGLSRAVSL